MGNLKKKKNLNSFERTNLRQIFETVRENGLWKFRYNEANYIEYKDPHLVFYFKFSKYKKFL